MLQKHPPAGFDGPGTPRHPAPLDTLALVGAHTLRLGIAVLAATLCLPAIAAAAVPRLATGSGYFVRPAGELQLSADNSVQFDGSGGRTRRPWTRNVRWTRWDRRFAVGRGALYENDCVPSCARGTFTGYPGTVRASRVRGGRYTRLRISYHKHGRMIVRVSHLVNENTSYPWWLASPFFT